ncbi:DegT/DnrJ/EryC1/StrS aminotransferase family protein [uncultured Corynebacterium sp.]|uniref:DegT/DnrJ/EryC1/StrS family aminotransferase n=1 Tax=uncultured Corynebacterium sp. TaxID=159447 RepID=UPI0025E070DE|nr:aminotransferase class I/II-fold pyridoxal phosphate-dependent enzyme [uncultured Corynebacterium sp.]
MSSPDVGANEEAALIRAFRSGFIAPLGPEVDAFESEVAARCGREHAVALASGTSALHLGLIDMGIGVGDRVLTASMTFVATANAIQYSGAEQVFVDAADDGNIDVDLLAEAAETLRSEGTPASAIVPVDMVGRVCRAEEIDAIAAEYGIPVLWDAAESFGATHRGRPAGSFGDAAVVSFNGNKIMTTSGGGMLLTDSAETADKARYLSTQARVPAVHYEHVDVGYNYRMSNLLAGLGRAQLARLDEMITARRANREMYRELFAGIAGVRIFQDEPISDDSSDNCWLTAIVVDPDEAPFTAEELRLHLAEENIETRPLWKPMHLQPLFRDRRAFVNGTSEELFRTGLTLPSGSALTVEQKSRIGESISNFLREARS